MLTHDDDTIANALRVESDGIINVTMRGVQTEEKIRDIGRQIVEAIEQQAILTDVFSRKVWGRA